METSNHYGTFPLSAEILSKQKNGLWAIEIDEGAKPRMYVDDVMLELLGMTERVSPEDTYQKWYDAIDSDVYGIVKDVIERINKGENAEVQYPWHHPDGTTRIVRCGGLRNFDYKDGVRIEGTHRDITGTIHLSEERIRKEKYLVERYLKKSKGAFVVDLSTGGVSKLKSPGKIGDSSVYDSINSHDQLVRLYADTFVLPNDREKVISQLSLKSITQRLREVDYFEVEHRISYGDVPIWYTTHVSKMSHNEAFVNFKDCTNDVLNSTFWDAIATQMISGYIVDLDTETVYEVKKSPVFDFKTEDNHYSIENLVEKSRALMDPEYYPGWLEFTAKDKLIAIRENSTHAEYTYASHCTGELRWVRATVYSLGRDVPYLALRFSLYTKEHIERKRQEDELNQALSNARIADEASKLKTLFVQNISHDIRTPLNAIVGFSQLLSLPDGFLSDEEKSQYCEYVKDSTDLLTMIVNDVLCMSDVEKGILNINKVDTSCNEIIRKSVNCSASRTPPGVRMYYTSDVDSGYYVNTDPKRVQQILVNFLSNSCKHTTEGEIIVNCSVMENPGHVTFSVTDTGEGVSESIAEDIFNRFVTLDSMKDGHGMGLNICRDLADRLGGIVRLDRTYKNGARFVLIIPANEKITVPVEKLQKLLVDARGEWSCESNALMVVGGEKPIWSSKDVHFQSLTVHEDMTVAVSIQKPDGVTMDVPLKFIFAPDGSVTYEYSDGVETFRSSKRNILLKDERLIITFDRDDVDGMVNIPSEMFDIPWDYCKTTFIRK
ncbi:MAG: HAMP domain-containing histidine kinase [Bacteroidales bacterium]|nr:HAMP domain-containing histidine kinase [Bacteroidales bacterium]